MSDEQHEVPRPLLAAAAHDGGGGAGRHRDGDRRDHAAVLLDGRGHPGTHTLRRVGGEDPSEKTRTRENFPFFYLGI